MANQAVASWACGHRSPQMPLQVRPLLPWPLASTARCLAPKDQSPLHAQQPSARCFTSSSEQMYVLVLVTE